MSVNRRGYFVVSGIGTYSMYSMDFIGTREIPLVSTLRLIKSNKPTKARMIYRPKGKSGNISSIQREVTNLNTK